MKNTNDPKEKAAPKVSQDDASATVPQSIPANSWVDPHDKHTAMTWNEFIMYRFLRVQ